MKNKINASLSILINMFMPIIYLLFSCSLAAGLLYVLYITADNLYRTSRYNFITYSVGYFMYLKRLLHGDLIYVIIFTIISLCIYAAISYKKSKNMISLIENVEEMANGNLNNVIDLDDSGNIKKLANNINDIVTQLRNITIEERKAQQTKTDLITNVSHDLRTPLTSIIGYLSIIEDDKYKDEVQLRYYTNIAYEKAQTLNLLINDLFDLTKMQNHAMTLNTIQIDLVELLGQITAQSEYIFKNENVECRTKFSDDKLIVQADAIKLVRAFENLITNAIKYGKDGRYIDITTEKIDDMAIIKIINYGEPIPAIDLPHIFDRFYRVEKSRNRNDGGSGLGLAITKNIIELHEGNISVSSDYDCTIFEVQLKLDSI